MQHRAYRVDHVQPPAGAWLRSQERAENVPQVLQRGSVLSLDAFQATGALSFALQLLPNLLQDCGVGELALPQPMFQIRLLAPQMRQLFVRSEPSPPRRRARAAWATVGAPALVCETGEVGPASSPESGLCHEEGSELVPAAQSARLPGPASFFFQSNSRASSDN